MENNFKPNGLHQGLFTLLVNEDQTQACLDFNPTDQKYPKELVESSFMRECRMLFDLKGYNVSWMPEHVNVDIGRKKIYFDWYGNSCEDFLPDNWQLQLENIVKDLHKYKIYKPNFYPKCFYTDQNGTLRAYSFYTSCNYNESIIDVDFYKPILNPDRLEVVEKLAVNGKLDVALLYERACLDYIQWPDNALREIYLKVLKSSSE